MSALSSGSLFRVPKCGYAYRIRLADSTSRSMRTGKAHDHIRTELRRMIMKPVRLIAPIANRIHSGASEHRVSSNGPDGSNRGVFGHGHLQHILARAMCRARGEWILGLDTADETIFRLSRIEPYASGRRSYSRCRTRLSNRTRRRCETRIDLLVRRISLRLLICCLWLVLHAKHNFAFFVNNQFVGISTIVSRFCRRRGLWLFSRRFWSCTPCSQLDRGRLTRYAPGYARRRGRRGRLRGLDSGCRDSGRLDGRCSCTQPPNARANEKANRNDGENRQCSEDQRPSFVSAGFCCRQKRPELRDHGLARQYLGLRRFEA